MKNILKNKYYLYMTEFFAGMSVMAVELGASRLLAPYFSSSQIVWTIIIGTIMIAMALGNIWGGRSADKNPNPDKLYQRLMVAAIWIAAIPLLGKYIILAISGLLVLTVSNHFLVIAAFIACMVIFVYPLFLLGTVTPSLVKYTVDSLEDSGSTVGTLGAFNTIGSIIGTFLPTFVTIPAVGTAITFLIFSGVLLLLSLIYFISKKSGKKICALACVLFLLCSVFGHSDSFAFWETDLAYEGESIYNYLQVKETDSRVILSTNVLFGVQSVKMKEDGLTGMYYDYALAAPFLAGVMQKDSKSDVLILGMGTGTFATQCKNYFSDAFYIEGVEIDQKITDLAGEYFDLPDDVAVTTYDGRAYLQAVDKQYDVIMVDAYQDITIPFQMSSQEFFSEVKAHLKPNGVMVVNMNMKSDGEDSINAYLSDTIASVFDQVYTVDVTDNTNRELFASDNPQMLELMQEGTAVLTDSQLSQMMQTVADSMIKYEAGSRILTDDKAPVEVLGMRVIDEIIADEIGYFKDIFKENGIQGILQSM
ncbi:MAG: fused MFS/spermidine synthase [Eubacterium sp.]|nr:fused MFS/spermidine synthase [Eubacterium sp.]